jgi:hypothetical protein
MRRFATMGAVIALCVVASWYLLPAAAEAG